jgi:hypothetical protein
MKIAVVQHRLRESAEADALALGEAARAAATAGAGFVVFPEVFSLRDGLARERLERALDEHLGATPYVMPRAGLEVDSMVFETTVLPGISERLGSLVLLVGDACIDPEALSRVADEMPAVAILSPRSESDIQAEAVIEFAIGLSESLAGLVIVVDPAGAAPGEPGHGESAIISVGEVLAEAVGPDDVLLAEVGEPAPQPVPREPVPPVPPILAQRLAHHQGRVPEVDYPADLS